MPKLVDHDARRRQIARAAMEEIAAGGLDALKLADVAARAGWTTGVLTHYFRNKEDLLKQALQVTLDEVVRDLLVDAEDRGRDLPDLLRAWLPCHPGRMTGWKAWLAFVGSGQFSASDRQRHEAYYALMSERIRQRLEGAPLRVEAQVAADLLLAFFDGLSTRVIMEPEQWPRARQEALLASYIGCLFGARA